MVGIEPTVDAKITVLKEGWINTRPGADGCLTVRNRLSGVSSSRSPDRANTANPKLAEGLGPRDMFAVSRERVLVKGGVPEDGVKVAVTPDGAGKESDMLMVGPLAI